MFPPAAATFSTIVSPYARFNLRRNPFGELTPEERAELAMVDVQRWVEFLRGPAAVQFVGPCGRGKTTHLLAIRRRLPSAVYLLLPETGPRPAMPDQRPLLIDEAQRLGFWQRRRVFAAGGPLALGTHGDLGPALRRSGLEVVTVELAAEGSPERLAQILNRRIEASRLTPAAVPRIELAHAVSLRDRFGSDVRQIEHHLYLQFQDAAQKGVPWPIAP